MNKLNTRLLLAGVMSVGLLAGCGGGNNNNNSGGGNNSSTTPTADLSNSVSAVIAYISNLITNNTENSDQVDVNAVTLAVDDSAEPTSLK